MTRPLLLLILTLVLVASGATASGASTVAERTMISGGGLPQTVRLAPADDDAFGRRINTPPKLEETPHPGGPSYTVTSTYWDAALRDRPSDAPIAEERAEYYPEGGFVRTRRDGKDIWIVIDLRQRAILDRYIRLVKQSALDNAPGIFDVLRAAATTELIGVAAGGHELTEEQNARFWQLARDVKLRRDLIAGQPRVPEAGGSSSTWMLFTLPEGRTVQMLYSVTTAVLVDATGNDLYPVPARWLEPVLGSAAVFGGPGYDLAPASIEQQDGAGSPLWWLLMVGGGLACIAAAVWLLRVWPASSDGA